MKNFTIFQSNTRGQAELIGFIILVGIGVASAGFMIAVGASPIQDLQAEANEENYQGGFSSMGSNITNTAFSGDGGSQSIDVSFTGSEGSLDVQENSKVKISAVDPNGNKNEILENELGNIQYETENGTELYYENGGIWSVHQSGGVERITAPEFHYRDETLTFPIIEVKAGDNSINNRIRATQDDSGRTTDQLFIDEEIIEIQIDSPVYQGWGEYFEDEVEGSTVRYDHDNDIVYIQLGTASQHLDSFTDAALSGGDIEIGGNNAEIDGDATASETISDPDAVSGNVNEGEEFDLLGMDNIIESRINSADTELSSLGGETLTEGTYVIGSETLQNETLTVDLSDGDVSLAVDGDLEIRNGSTINVINGEGDAKFETFVDGDVEMARGNPEWTVSDGESQRNILYASTDSRIQFSQNAEFDGVVYAPSTGTSGSSGSSNVGNNAPACQDENAALCLGVNTEINGAVVSGSTHMGQNSKITYDEANLSDFDFETQLEDEKDNRPELTFLHTSNTTLTIEDDNTN